MIATLLAAHDIPTRFYEELVVPLPSKTVTINWFHLDQIEHGYSKEQKNDLEINAIRGEAVALHNLNMNRSVPDILLQRACNTPAFRSAGSFWEPIVMRDVVDARVEIPRFGMRDVNKIIGRIASVCEQKNDEFMLLLIHESWLRALIKHDKTKLAQRIFREEMDRLPHLPYVGSLHRALLLKSGAKLAWEMRDRTAWKAYIGEALDLMVKSGLTHQVNQVRQTYGTIIDPIIADHQNVSGGF